MENKDNLEEKNENIENENLDETDGLEVRVYNKKAKPNASWWGRKTRGQKTSFIISIVLLTISIAATFILIFCRQIFGDEVGNEIIGEGNLNGFVAFGKSIRNSLGKVGISFLVISITFLITFIISGILKLSTNKSNKGRTISSLTRSLLKYLAILADLAIILTIWGVDVASIVAGLGVLSLIVGLGCQTLIQDIISGLFIVFDDYFNVGDMVIIDGFRGYVSEIGLRTVKLDDKCGNIKAITNSNVGTCVNLSRQTNLISITMSCGYNEDIRRVEAVIAKELPKIRERLPKIVDGPTYKGIDAISDSSIDFGFSVRCKAMDRFQVKRDFTREVYLMFVLNDISIPFNQIVVNPQDDQNRPSATAEEIEIAESLNQKNREIAPKPKKESFLKRAKETFIDDMDNIYNLSDTD